MFLADFHIHSTFSDGKMAIPEIVDLYGERGFGAIAITDHLCENQSILGKASAYLGCSLTPATFPLYLEILKSERERAWDQYGMVLTAGVELTQNSISNHRSAHIIALGIDKYFPAQGDPVELVKQIHDQNGIAIAAHPVWTRKIEKQSFLLWDRREELAQVFDAWEVASGPYIFPKVRDSKVPKIASSDMHLKRQLTSWKTSFECERHERAIFDAIVKQEIGFRFYDGRIENELAQPFRSSHLEHVDWRHNVGNLARAGAL